MNGGISCILCWKNIFVLLARLAVNQFIQRLRPPEATSPSFPKQPLVLFAVARRQRWWQTGNFKVFEGCNWMQNGIMSSFYSYLNACKLLYEFWRNGCGEVISDQQIMLQSINLSPKEMMIYHQKTTNFNKDIYLNYNANLLVVLELK